MAWSRMRFGLSVAGAASRGVICSGVRTPGRGGAVLVQRGGAVFATAQGFAQVVLQGLAIERAQVAPGVGVGKLAQQAAVGGEGLRAFAAFVTQPGEVVVDVVHGDDAAGYAASSPW